MSKAVQNRNCHKRPQKSTISFLIWCSFSKHYFSSSTSPLTLLICRILSASNKTQPQCPSNVGKHNMTSWVSISGLYSFMLKISPKSIALSYQRSHFESIFGKILPNRFPISLSSGTFSSLASAWFPYLNTQSTARQPSSNIISMSVNANGIFS